MAFKHECVGHRGDENVRVEVRDRLRAGPALVADTHRNADYRPLTSARRLSYPTVMTLDARFEHLLSTRARIGWGGPVATARLVANPRYEFGGGYPDPASFPYDGMVEATARMMNAEGAEALTYGEPQGYAALRELVCHKYRVFEGLAVTPENIFVANGAGHALSLAFSAFVDPGDPIICEAPTFAGSPNTIRRHGPAFLDAPRAGEGVGRRGG